MTAFAPIGFAPPGGPYGPSVVIAEPDPSTIEPITLEQAKRHLRVVIDDENADIEFMITAARNMLEQRLQRVLVPRQVTEFAWGFATNMPLSVVPYLDDLVVEYTDPNGDGFVLDNAAYEMDITTEPAVLFAATGTQWPVTRYARGVVKLHYRAGYAEGQVPASLRQWMLLAIGTMYAHRESIITGVSVTPLPDDFMQWLYQPYVVYR